MTKEQLLDAINISEYGSAKLGDDYLSYGSLARVLYEDVSWFFDKQEGSYQGDWYMVGRDREGRYYFFAMGYGSCSGCDWLEGACTKEELAKIIDAILETPIYANKEAALEYAKKFDWRHSYDREDNDPFVKEVVAAIEAN